MVMLLVSFFVLRFTFGVFRTPYQLRLLILSVVDVITLKVLKMTHVLVIRLKPQIPHRVRLIPTSN